MCGIALCFHVFPTDRWFYRAFFLKVCIAKLCSNCIVPFQYLNPCKKKQNKTKHIRVKFGQTFDTVMMMHMMMDMIFNYRLNDVLKHYISLKQLAWFYRQSTAACVDDVSRIG